MPGRRIWSSSSITATNSSWSTAPRTPSRSSSSRSSACRACSWTPRRGRRGSDHTGRPWEQARGAGPGLACAVRRPSIDYRLLTPLLSACPARPPVMPILPLPQFEADLAQLEEEDRKLYESLKAPKTVVVRFGSMKLIGEFAADGTLKPGCGSKLVCRTHRGTELGEMLTSTCANSGCSKSVSRQEMLKYIENSGGHDYPFFTEGRVLRL